MGIGKQAMKLTIFNIVFIDQKIASQSLITKKNIVPKDMQDLDVNPAITIQTPSKRDT